MEKRWISSVSEHWYLVFLLKTGRVKSFCLGSINQQQLHESLSLFWTLSCNFAWKWFILKLGGTYSTLTSQTTSNMDFIWEFDIPVFFGCEDAGLSHWTEWCLCPFLLWGWGGVVLKESSFILGDDSVLNLLLLKFFVYFQLLPFLFSTSNAGIIILMICSHNNHHISHIVISFLHYRTVRSFVS